MNLEEGDSVLASDGDNLSGFREEGNSLGHNLFACLLGGVLCSVVFLDPLEEGLVATTLTDVLDSHVNTLAELSATNKLVHLNSNSVLCHVEHYTGSAVVELMGHTLVDRRIRIDVHVVTALECCQVPGSVGHTSGSERLTELLAGLASVTKVRRHSTETAENNQQTHL